MRKSSRLKSQAVAGAGRIRAVGGSWWPGGVLIVLLTIVVYLPALGGGFVFDDDQNVTGNELLRTVGGLIRIWVDPHASYQFYPLTYTGFWIGYHLWGLHPTGYHVVNVLLHGANAFLLGLLLSRLAVPGAWLAAVLFAVHPVHVQSVAWITELKNVLSGFFFLCAFLVYLRFQRGDEPRRRFYLLALFLFVCALFSKTSTAALPGAILLVLWWKQERIRRQDVSALVPFLVVAAVLGLLTAWLEVHGSETQGREWQLTFLERCLIAGRVLWFYAGKLVWPHPLMLVYPRWQIDTGVWWQYLFPAAAVAVVLLLWFYRARLGKGPLVAALFFAGMLVPTPAFIDIGFMRYSYVADHWAYLPGMALVAVVAGWAGNVFHRGTARRCAVVIVAAALGFLSWQHAKVFRDDATLFADSLAHNPRSWLVCYNLGTALMREGRPLEAIDQYEQALRLKPEAAEARNSLGLALLRLGKTEAAIAQYQQALRLKPEFFEAHYNLGGLLLKSGKAAEAAAEFEQAVRLKPGNAGAQNGLGAALLQQGNITEAQRHFSEALRIAPDMAEAHHNLGNILLRLGDVTGAIDHYRRALRNNPDHAEARNNLGLALFQVGRVEEARAQFAEALRIRPDYSIARSNLVDLQSSPRAPQR